MPRKINVKTGDRYGQLTIIKEVEHRKQFRQFLCRCSCGKEIITGLNALRMGNTQSCGCFQKSIVSTQRGLSRSQIYRVHRDMITRCKEYRTCKAWNRYGAKGIRVCQEWQGKDGFLNFYNWSITHGYTDEKVNGRNKVTIDRIDSTKDYSPDNCRWVDYKTQNSHLHICSRNTSGYKGVSKVKSSGSYRVRVQNIHVGSYKTIKEAVEARNDYIDKHHLMIEKDIYTGE